MTSSNAIFSVIKPFDQKLLKKHIKDILKKYPPVFIVGAPRTGSTIFYLLVTAYWDIDYINNFQCLLKNIPTLGCQLSNILFSNKYNKNFYSKQGKTKGLNSPSECGGFWYTWFPKDRHYVPKGELDKDTTTLIRNTINSITSINQKNLFFKNMNCGQRIGALSEIVPEAFFIYCKRNPLYVAQSLLLTRKKVYKTIEKWWSIMPKEYSEIIQHSPERQVVEQVYYIEKQIQEDLNKYYPDNYCKVKYEELIKNPKKELESIIGKLKEKRLNIKLRSTYEKMPSMPSGNYKKIDDKTFLKLEEITHEILGKI